MAKLWNDQEVNEYGAKKHLCKSPDIVDKRSSSNGCKKGSSGWVLGLVLILAAVICGFLGQ